jgi:hypothetical protein
MGQARALALDMAPAPESLGGQYVRSNVGPSLHGYNPESGGGLYGVDARLERWCLYNGTSAATCTWVARMAMSRDSETHMSFVRANFSMERAVQFLRANNVAPGDVRAWPPQPFGLPDPLDVGPMPYVNFGQATEAECAQVGAALEEAQRARTEIALSASRPPPDPSRPATRRPPLHAGMMEITFPDWFVQGRGVESSASVVVRDYGPNTLAPSFAQSIFQPLTQCPQMSAVR